MSRRPLLKLANDREVKQASEFRGAAEGLTGEQLAVHFQQEVASAPRRSEAGLAYLAPYSRRLSGTRRKNRDEEHLAVALTLHFRKHGGGLELPGNGGEIVPVHGPVPLATAPPNKGAGGDDPNWSVGSVGFVGLGPDERLVVAHLKYVPPQATRPGVGETPLRLLLTSLGHAAIAQRNQAEIAKEMVAAGAAAPSDAPPLVALIATPRYWTLCRKREAQRGAAWIKEHERLAREIEEETGVRVVYLAIELQGDPGWSYVDGQPVLDAPPKLRRAWELGAGRVRPKPRPKPAAEADPVVEPDLSRPPRSYSARETFSSGDRIEHSTLGLGVVQGIAGPGKIHVLFGERKVLLVHGREA